MMLQILTRKFKPFSLKMRNSSLKIIRSSGLIPLYNFIVKSPLQDIIAEEFHDRRDQNLIQYLASEFLLATILRLIDGSIRMYHFRHKVNNDLFEQLFKSGQVPHFTTLIYFFKRNIDHAHHALERIMFRYGLWVLKQEIRDKGLKKITIDVDATAASLYGIQEGAEKGYNPEKRNAKCRQLQVWSIRETKTLLKVELRNGSVHCSNGFLDDLQLLIPELQKLGVKIRLFADSGYENYAAFNYLDERNDGFVIAQKQREKVKRSGKWAKKRKKSRKFDCTLKERLLKTKVGVYRQIFVQVDRVYDEDGQLYFLDFAADEFTNVFATNMNLQPQTIYGLYREHAQVETIIGELKAGFGTVKSRCSLFNVNQSLVQLCGIAYTAKTFYASRIVQNKDQIPDITTLRDEEIHVPGYFANHSGKHVFNVISSSYERLNTLFSRVAAFNCN